MTTDMLDSDSVRALLRREGARTWQTLVAQHGRSFSLAGMWWTAEPELVEALLRQRAHTVERAQLHRQLPWLAPGLDGILFMDGEPWQQRARFTSRSLSRAALRTMTQVSAARVDAAIGAWPSHIADLYPHVERLTTEIACDTLLGLDPERAQVARALDDIRAWRHRQEAPASRVDAPLFGPRQLVRVLLARGGLRRARARIERSLGALLPTARPDSWSARGLESGLGPAELAREANHLLWAYDAVNFVATGMIAELARRPQLREALDAECSPLADQPLGLSELEQLPLTRGVVNEALRLYVGTMGVARRSGAPLSCASGVTIPADSTVLIMLSALHRDPEWWPEPERFDPARWAHAARAGSFLPFLIGPRRCLGQHFARMLLAQIARRISREPLQGGALPPWTSFMIPRFAGPVIVTRHSTDHQLAPARA